MGRDEDFTEFVEARTRPLLRLAFLLAGDTKDARDLVQEVLATMYLRWSNIHSVHAADACARTAITREATSWLRAKLHQYLSQDFLPAIPAHSGLPVEDRMAVLAALRALPPRRRAVLVLKYYEDLSDAEVAQTLGCSPGTVRDQDSRGIAELTNALNPKFSHRSDVPKMSERESGELNAMLCDAADLAPSELHPKRHPMFLARRRVLHRRLAVAGSGAAVAAIAAIAFTGTALR